MVNCPLQIFLGPALDLHPAVLHQPSHRPGAVEFRAVGRGELELDANLLQQSECWSDGFGAVDGCFA